MDLKHIEKLQFKLHPWSLPDGPFKHQESLNQTNILPRKNIRLLTYNMYMRPPPVKTNESDHKDDRLVEFAKKLDDFDIVCCQEVFTSFNTRKQRLITYAQKAGFAYHACTEGPSFFEGYFTDSGLLILSRFPIVETEFHPYPYGVLSDALSKKGVLYAKIVVGDHRVLHLFNTHTQASYYNEGLDNFVATFETRYQQLRLARKYIAAKTKDASENDLIIFAGDFNANGQKENRKAKAFRQQLSHRPDFDEHFDELENEYKTMYDILSGNGADTLVDCARIAHKGESPVTYADVVKDFQGNHVPSEIVLTDAEDYCTQQSLDYIFQIVRNPKSIKPTYANQSFNSPLIVEERNIEMTNIQVNKKLDISKGDSNFRHEKYIAESKTRENSGQHASDAEKVLGPRLEINVSETVIEKFFIDGQIFTQLSDHYGISTSIDVI